jgi:dihydroorotase-like cyclic amidohydrolase
MTDLVIVGGTAVTPDGSVVADVAIADGRIERIGPDLATDGVESFDASGMLVLPGVIDVHTHLRLPDAEHPHRFSQDTIAAAAGGTTTILTFNNPGTGISDEGARSPLRGLDEFRARTAGE